MSERNEYSPHMVEESISLRAGGGDRGTGVGKTPPSPVPYHKIILSDAVLEILTGNDRTVSGNIC